MATSWASDYGFECNGHSLERFCAGNFVACSIHRFFDVSQGGLFAIIFDGGRPFLIRYIDCRYALDLGDLLLDVMFAARTGHAFNGHISYLLRACLRGLHGRWILILVQPVIKGIDFTRLGLTPHQGLL